MHITPHPSTPTHTPTHTPQIGAPGTEGASVSPKAREGRRTGASWSGSQGTRGGKQEARNGRTEEEASPREARSPREDSCRGTCVRRCHCGGVFLLVPTCVCTLHVFSYLMSATTPGSYQHPFSLNHEEGYLLPTIARKNNFTPSPAPHPW